MLYDTSALMISIHALLAESDSMGSVRGCFFCVISIHALLAESDVGVAKGADSEHISIHALLAESDLFSSVSDSLQALFLSTLSLRRAT